MKNGADVNAQDVNGRFAIHYAAQRFHPSTLKAMLIAEKIFDATQNRAINYRDKRGMTPFMLACRKVPIDLCHVTFYLE
jgi:ankyrin repeat protein